MLLRERLEETLFYVHRCFNFYLFILELNPFFSGVFTIRFSFSSTNLTGRMSLIYDNNWVETLLESCSGCFSLLLELCLKNKTQLDSFAQTVEEHNEALRKSSDGKQIASVMFSSYPKTTWIYKKYQKSFQRIYRSCIRLHLKIFFHKFYPLEELYLIHMLFLLPLSI